MRPVFSDLIVPEEITIWESLDGVEWQSYTPEWLNQTVSLAFENHTLFASFPPRATTNGFLWKTLPTGDPAFHFGRDQWLAANGLRIHSTLIGTEASRDGVNWSSAWPESLEIRSLAYGRGRWIALDSGAAHASLDGFNWKPKVILPDVWETSTNVAPAFLEEPEGRTVLTGASALLQAQAIARGELQFQWFRGEDALPGATNDYLYFPKVSGAHAGDYRVVAMNAYGSVTSSWAALIVPAMVPPQILNGPENVSAPAGSPVALTVLTSGSELGYRWFHNGVEIPWIRGPVLTLAHLSSWDTGSYEVEATNSVGAVRSGAAVVTLKSPVFTTDWEPVFQKESEKGPDWRGAAYGNGRFVLVGGDDAALVSTNGIQWAQARAGSKGAPVRLDFDGSRFLAVTAAGEVIESTDGERWSIAFDAGVPLTAIGSAPGRAVAGGPVENSLCLRMERGEPPALAESST
jgi:hypothetical protein